MSKYFWKAPNKTCRNKNDNNWSFYNSIDGLNRRFNTSEKQVQDRVKILTQTQQQKDN